MRSPLTIGSRGSQLALWQANYIKDALERELGVAVQLEIIKTTGDKITGVPLASIGGTKALFTKEIEEALLEKRVDLAVHSMKDMPTILPDGLVIGAVPKREDPRDALLTRNGKGLEELPEGARIGTSSLRREVQLKRLRRDLEIVTLRGNLDTRIRKLEEGQYDAIVLAAAGLKRLGWADKVTEYLEPEKMLPAVGQGALAIEVRGDDAELLEGLACLRHADTEAATKAERAFLKKVEGGCQVPMAAHATVESGQLSMRAIVVSLDGERSVEHETSGPAAEAEKLGTELAAKLLADGAAEIMAEIQQSTR